MTISRNAPLSGGGRSRMKISLNFIEFHWIQQILEMNKEKDRKKRLRREKKDKKKEKIIFVGGSRSSGPCQAARQGRLWPSRAFSRSYFFKVKWIFNEFLPKFDRLVLGCINEFLNFFFEFVERVLLIRSFLKKNAKIRKKKREKNLNENCKNHDFCGFFDFEVAQKRQFQRIFKFFLRDDVECNQISALVKK